MPDVKEHEARSQSAADTGRKLLSTLAVGGMVAAYTVRDSQHGDLWRGAILFFAITLVCVVRSWFLVKERELRRRDNVLAGQLPPVFPWHMHSWTWDRAGAASLVVGALLLAIGFAP